MARVVDVPPIQLAPVSLESRCRLGAMAVPRDARMQSGKGPDRGCTGPVEIEEGRLP
jgi:hypothetical protein